MKKILITIALIAVLCASMFAVVGCSGNEIVVHTNAFFAPFEYYNASQEIVGVDIEIMGMVGEKLGKKVVFEDKDFATLIDSVSEGKVCDCAAAGITITPQRQEKVNFSTPYYTSIQYVIFKKGTLTVSKNANNEDIVLWSSLAGKKIGVQMDTTGDIYVDIEINGDGDYVGELQADGQPDHTPYETAQLAYESLKAQSSIDVVVIDELPAQYLIKNDTANYACLPLYYDAETATEEQYAIAVNKDQTELLEAINAVLAELLADVDANGVNAVERMVMEHFGA